MDEILLWVVMMIMGVDADDDDGLRMMEDRLW